MSLKKNGDCVQPVFIEDGSHHSQVSRSQGQQVKMVVKVNTHDRGRPGRVWRAPLAYSPGRDLAPSSPASLSRTLLGHSGCGGVASSKHPGTWWDLPAAASGVLFVCRSSSLSSQSSSLTPKPVTLGGLDPNSEDKLIHAALLLGSDYTEGVRIWRTLILDSSDPSPVSTPWNPSLPEFIQNPPLQPPACSIPAVPLSHVPLPNRSLSFLCSAAHSPSSLGHRPPCPHPSPPPVPLPKTGQPKGPLALADHPSYLPSVDPLPNSLYSLDPVRSENFSPRFGVCLYPYYHFCPGPLLHIRSTLPRPGSTYTWSDPPFYCPFSPFTAEDSHRHRRLATGSISDRRSTHPDLIFFSASVQPSTL
ncbi:hypothetical protein KSP39_PZI007435 [Platanthera zijinensis]|uniref:Uncharacterized protein n=1 Tax=Platanthera zijinensis TaxID=2320716 RepID=A0AAP0GA62_9ASPA